MRLVITRRTHTHTSTSACAGHRGDPLILLQITQPTLDHHTPCSYSRKCISLRLAIHPYKIHHPALALIVTVSLLPIYSHHTMPRGQVRLSLDDLPDLLYKLCSAAPLCWSDLMAVYGPGATASKREDESTAMLRYLSEHGVAAKLNEAVNALGKARPADPMAFLVEQLQKK